MIKAVLRIVIALIFIASGFVKAVDPIGFSFKLEEYFSAGVFNMPFLEPFALPISIFVVALELILGVALLFNIKTKKVLAVLIALCIFFAFLTFYSAYFNKVTDCGCFGDAIKFTPWQSFIKDIILLVGLLILWVLYKKEFTIQKSNGIQKIALLFSIFFTGFILVYGIIREPLIDFRSYKIGTNMKLEQQKIAQYPSVYKVFYTAKNEKTGEEKSLDQDEYVNNKIYWEEGSPWKLLDDKTESKLVKEGYKSEISKFKLDGQDGSDWTQKIIAAPKAIVIFSYHPNLADKAVIQKAQEKAKKSGNTLVLGVAPNFGVYQAIPAATMDGTAIKTIARSNPSVLILENGTIVDKVPGHVFVEN